jgi:hypothetical protein
VESGQLQEMAGEGLDFAGAEVRREGGDLVTVGPAGVLALLLGGSGIGGLIQEGVGPARCGEEEGQRGNGPHADGGLFVCPFGPWIGAEGLGMEAEAEGDEEIIGPQGQPLEE